MENIFTLEIAKRLIVARMEKDIGVKIENKIKPDAFSDSDFGIKDFIQFCTVIAILERIRCSNKDLDYEKDISSIVKNYASDLIEQLIQDSVMLVSSLGCATTLITMNGNAVKELINDESDDEDAEDE